jgi:probable phosphoglycerate mutase
VVVLVVVRAVVVGEDVVAGTVVVVVSVIVVAVTEVAVVAVVVVPVVPWSGDAESPSAAAKPPAASATAAQAVPIRRRGMPNAFPWPPRANEWQAPRMAQEVVLVRHGETEWTRTLQHTSRTDVPLTDAGRRQAEQLGTALRGRSFALVLTSPLGRATETCRLAGFGDSAQTRDDLREWDYGDYEGLTTAEIRERAPGWTIFRDDAPNGETAREVGERADRVIAEARAADGDVLLFSHGHFLRVLGARWLGLDPRDGRLLALDPGSLSALGHEHETAVLRLWNRSFGAS